MKFSPSKKQIVKGVIFALVSLIAIYVWLSGILASITQMLDQKTITMWIDDAGLWGALLIISLMTLAVVASPIPSAPIAIAAGAVYGHTLGTVYIVLGAFLGAMIAFGLSRWLGYKQIRRWFGSAVDRGLLGSQNALTATIFFSRIMPFVSFDMISYAAGLSNISTWRFAMATLFGVVPTAFLMAHLGQMAIEGDDKVIVWFSVILGVVVAASAFGFGYKKFRE